MTNPLLQTKIPGRVFALPSMGIFYDKGVLADHVKNGEVQVKPMSAITEMKLRSPDLLFSGIALREVCQECIPDILKPEQLVSRDVDAIFCFLKIVTYGSDLNFKSSHSCPKAEIHDYQVNLEQLVIDPRNACLKNKDLLYQIKLQNGMTVRLRPVTYQDSIDIIHLRQELDRIQEDSGKLDQPTLEKMIIRDLLSAIKSVETVAINSNEKMVVNVTDTQQIEEWLRTLTKKQIDEITEQAARTNEWGFNLTVKLACKDCGETYNHNLEVDPINFFSG